MKHALPKSGLVALAITLAIVACSTKADSVCENVGDCEQGGSSEWIKACQENARQLLAASQTVSCDGFFYVYYRCADDNYTCTGATASFPGCEAKRGNLDDCLAREQTKTACGELERRTTACATDAGRELPTLPAGGCTTTRECAAHCYLDHVTDPCAPRPDELTATSGCVATCPP